MNHYDTFIKTLFALLLAFFFSSFTFAQTPAWALGEQPNFSGTIVDWVKGDAIAPGESAMSGRTYSGDAEGADVGFGSIKRDGSFSFGLQRRAAYAGTGHTPDLSMCPGAKRSNPKQKLVAVNAIEVPALYEDGVHARPGGAILISVGRPMSASMKAVYLFVHASSSGTLRGTCTFNGQTGSVDLDLRRGWNAVKIDPIALSFKTAAISREARWYFVNPNTASANP